MALYNYSKYNSVIGNYKTQEFLVENYINTGVLGSRSTLAGTYTYYPSYAINTSSGYYGTGTGITRITGQSPVAGYYLVMQPDFIAKIEVTSGMKDGYVWNYIISRQIEGIYTRGTLISGNITAENGTLPTNGRHTDGYWYVRGSLFNDIPTTSLATTDNRTLYENDTFTVGGTATDINSGNVVNVKYQINSGTVRAITTSISSGSAIPFNKVLTFKNKALFDGSTAVTDTLAEGTQHVLKVWAEDDQGGKSAEVIRIFYVIPNRPAALTINPFTLADKLINTDKITVSGSVSDPDANTVTVKYKIANGSFIEVYSGSGGNFSFQVLLSALTVGPNTITVQAVDSYGSVTSKTLSVNKSENKQPLLTSVVQYKLTPPNATAKGVVLWIQREVGDLVLNAEISMGATGATENFVPMTKSATAFVATGIEEDEFTFENATAVENIVLKLTMTRSNATSNEGIKLISGVLS